MKIRNLLLIGILLTASSAFAHTSWLEGKHDKNCAAIAKACSSAGFDRQTEGKNIWLDCMKPLLLGHTVKDVNIDTEVVKSCKSEKIKELKEELKELQ